MSVQPGACLCRREANYTKGLLYIFVQCTWGLAQTALGLVFFLFTIRCPHSIYHGCVDTHWNLRKGLSLGMFIFTPAEEDEGSRRVRVHEYGHTIQSLILGPFYLLAALSSALWAGLPCFRMMRAKRRLPYTAFFVESWASRLGERVTGERAI